VIENAKIADPHGIAHEIADLVVPHAIPTGLAIAFKICD
jgi:hypothetical protein